MAQNKDYFAHTDLIHDAKLFKKGSKLPDTVPPDSLKALLAARHAGEKPPAQTKAPARTDAAQAPALEETPAEPAEAPTEPVEAPQDPKA